VHLPAARVGRADPAFYDAKSGVTHETLERARRVILEHGSDKWWSF
jgi:hypothetical protein